jgi:hypothetical protein
MKHLLICTVLLVAAPASAQESPFHADDQTEGFIHDLMRVLVSETGWDDRAEQAALGWTIARRVRRLRENRGRSGRSTLRAIADRALVEPRTRRQHWLHALDLTARRPPRWSDWTTARWNEPRAKAVVTFARDLVAGRVEDPCAGPTEYWGSRVHPTDRARIDRGIREGAWVPVSCGLAETARDNVYLRRTTGAERRAAQRLLPRNRVRYVN